MNIGRRNLLLAGTTSLVPGLAGNSASAAFRRQRSVVDGIVIGDSNTQRGRENGTAWCDMVYKNSGGKFVFENKGIHRNSSQMIADRFLTEVVAPRPDFCIITTGSVDLQEYGASEKAVLDDINWMTYKAHAAGIRVFVGCTPPMEAVVPGGPSHAGAVIRMNDLIGYWSRTSPATVINWNTNLLQAWDGSYNPGMNDDFVHPSLEGRKLMANKCLQVLEMVF